MKRASAARCGHLAVAAWLFGASAAAQAPTPPRAPQPAPPVPQERESPFTDPSDGAFDVSGFLASRQGFLPIVVPITEPAVGYGAAVGLAFLHDKPVARPGPPGEPARLAMPTTTMVFGALTENDTWLGGLAHLQTWDQGRVRYLGGAGYGSVHLNWYGRDDAFDGRSFDYTNDVFFLMQRLVVQVGDSDFYAGPQYRLTSTDSTFEAALPAGDIRNVEFDSTTSGLGVIVGYDSRDAPFMPRRGLRAEITVTDNAEWLGGDFDYWSAQGYVVVNTSITHDLLLGVHFETALVGDDAPFYDLPYINLRGIPALRYTDRASALLELELRYDFAPRWSLLAFGGSGRVADTWAELWSASDRPAGGAGFRYLIAREYGISMGIDVAYGDDDVAVYLGVGTGWPRP